VAQSIEKTPVLVVGGGPSGSILALALARFGIASIVLERRIEPAVVPKAHALNPRTQEICWVLGIDTDALKARSAPASESGWVQFAPRVTGPIFGSMAYERMDDGALEFTPFPLINIPQPEFEIVLHAAVEAQPLIDFRRGHGWERSSRTDDLVTSIVRGPEGEYEIASEYLIGADGASSAVRESLGISLSGDPDVNSAVSVIFDADLRPFISDRPGVLFWLTDPAIHATLLSYHADRLWALIVSLPAGPIDKTIYTPEYCEALVRNAMGYGPIDFDMEIIRIISWTVRSEIADRYRDGQVFLVGDAAHRFPPTGGLGLNTGVQDSHNLAWKIAAVRGGWADDALLDGYESERKPIAQQNADQSLANSHRLAALSELSCPAEIASDPVAFARWLETGGRRSRIATAIAAQLQHFDSFALQLGFSYSPDATTPEDISVFVPTANVGDRMPHCWIAGQGGARSALDLLDPTAFTLLAGQRGNNWLSVESPVPLTVVTVPEGADPQWLDLLGLSGSGALLVRPDGHIGARLPEGTGEAELAELLAGLLHPARVRVE
jgi:2,4-dichlorophenol 6-monooxygenase